MNIPQDTLQQVADEAFQSSNGGMMGLLTCNEKKNHVFWHEERYERRAVIQHAIRNPALAPFLAGGISEYTDDDICVARNMATRNTEDRSFPSMKWMHAFLAALPRRESPALASGPWSVVYNNDDNGAFSEWWDVESATGSYRAFSEESAKRLCDILNAKQSQAIAEAITRAEKAEKELAVLKSAQLGILRPIAEMPETVPDGCMAVTGYKVTSDEFSIGSIPYVSDTHFAILRLPAAEPTPPAEPDPSVQVPLGPEDVPPGSALRNAKGGWYSITRVLDHCVYIALDGTPYYRELKNDGWQINTSLPDTGRWDKDAWRPCSKTGK